MGKVCIVTDSTADLDRSLAERYGVTVVPLKVFFGRESYLDGFTITAGEFYDKLTGGNEISTTSQPSPAEFVDIYRPMIEEGSSIISIHISGRLSGTVQSARLARDMLGYADLEIFDSEAVSVVQGLMVIKAARAAGQGKSKEEILQMLQRAKDLTRVYFAVDTLEYLKRGGRIGKAQAFLGTLLNVKPILTIKDGIVHPEEKIRGMSRAITRLVELMKEKMPAGEPLQCFLIHSCNPSGLAQLRQGVEQELLCDEIVEGQLGPVVGTHAGPGLVGLSCCPVNL